MNPKALNVCCIKNRPDDYNPHHIYFCPDCETVHPPEKGFEEGYPKNEMQDNS